MACGWIAIAPWRENADLALLCLELRMLQVAYLRTYFYLSNKRWPHIAIWLMGKI